MTQNNKEPDPHGGPLRRFNDPAYVPLCRNLAEENIDALDQKIVALLAERGRYVKDAARFSATPSRRRRASSRSSTACPAERHAPTPRW